MIALHAKCNMCGRHATSIEVEVDATTEHKKRAGVSPSAAMATALCRDCVRAAVAAWAEHSGRAFRASAELAAELAKNGDGP